MVRFPRSDPERGTLAGLVPTRADTVRVRVRCGARQVRPGRPPPSGSVVTCKDVESRRIVELMAARTCGGWPEPRGAGRSEHGANLGEPTACPARIKVAGRFVQADVRVIFCIRFRTLTSWRTMEREASTKRTAAPGLPAWKRAEV
jgi:hypothetical protein